jgi:hypothetical protein
MNLPNLIVGQMSSQAFAMEHLAAGPGFQKAQVLTRAFKTGFRTPDLS